jgi:phosphoenolpyruvate-protein kinase (PTS system EI component)
MIRFTTLSLIGLFAIASSACEKPGVAEKQREQQANAELRQARDEAIQREQGAQGAADKAIGAARADFQKTREDYRHARAVDLIDIDKKIAALEAKEKTAPERGKAQRQADLSAIRVKREAVVRDMNALDNATAATWDEETARMNRDCDALKSAIDVAQ